jgi:hypothetical protein
MNYTELVAAIESTTENTFQTDEVNRFITQAEFRIYNFVQFPSLRKAGTLTASIGVQYVDAPTDMLAVDTLAVITPVTLVYTYLLNKDPSFIREAYPTVAATGTPKHYALYGPALTVGVPNEELRFLLGPTPDAAYSMEIQYFYYPESITVATSGTTWLSTNYSPALLYAALVEANVFMKGEQDITTMYEAKLKDALVEVKRLGDGLQQQDSYRSGIGRMPVK